MYEVRLKKPNGEIAVLTYLSINEANEAFEFAKRFEMEVLFNSMCFGCAKRGNDCPGTKNHAWNVCALRKEKMA